MSRLPVRDLSGDGEVLSIGIAPCAMRSASVGPSTSSSTSALTAALRKALAGLGTAERLDVRHLEAEARRRLMEWRDLLQTDVVAKSRQMLKKLLAEPLRARPVEAPARGWELTGRGSLGKLLAGLIVANTVASPTGHGVLYQLVLHGDTLCLLGQHPHLAI